MGKNANQIATWKDLNDYGFIIPSDKQSSLECVTYGDINGLNSTNPGISFNTSYYIHVPGSNVNTGVAPDKINTATTSITANQTNTIGRKYWIYRFQPTNVGLASIKSVTCPIKYSLYYTSTSRIAGKLQARILVYRGDVGSPSGSALITGTWKDLTSWDTNPSVTSGTAYKSNQSFSFSYSTTETDFFNIDDTNKYFYICVEFQIVPSSGSSCNIRMVCTAPSSFTGTHSNITFYSSKKCVPYQFIIQKNPTKTITCKLSEAVAGKTSADTIEFYYNYQVNGTWKSKSIGSVSLPDSAMSNGTETGSCTIPIRPNVTETVTSDYLSVKCGESGKQDWGVRYIYNGNDTGFVYLTNGTSAELKLNSMSYKSAIAGLSEIEFKVS